MVIDTDRFSDALRQKAVDPASRKLLITNFLGTSQAKDLTVPPNCQGFGRIRHFRRDTGSGWPSNPLPIDPACRALGLPAEAQIRAQVFQLAACNWRCWYCFVPDSLLSANLKHSEMLSAEHLIDLYLDQENRPSMIDLTGGQPDLVPEWVPWMMRALQDRGLENEVYLWSDDNLSNDFFWTYLSDEDRQLIATYPKYGRVGCFKGFNPESFAFNTKADPSLFERQFELFSRLLGLGIDLYAYATFTAPQQDRIKSDMCRFVDRLQTLDPNLPLRTVPLQVMPFTPVRERVGDRLPVFEQAINNQWIAIEAWEAELAARFTPDERNRSIVDVPLGTAGLRKPEC